MTLVWLLSRYQRGHRSLAANLALTAPGGDAEGPSPSVGSKEGEEQEVAEEEDYDIPEEVEEVIGGSGGGVVQTKVRASF